MESIGGPDEPLGMLTLFTSYACRHLVNLGRGDHVGAILARELVGLGTPLCPDTIIPGLGSTSLVPYAGSPGRKRFEARLLLEDHGLGFQMNPKGFGLLGR